MRGIYDSLVASGDASRLIGSYLAPYGKLHFGRGLAALSEQEIQWLELRCMGELLAMSEPGWTGTGR